MERWSGWDKFVMVMITIGAINWGIVGFFRYDLIGAIFGGTGAMISRIIFAIVGLAGVWAISLLFRVRGERRHHHG